MNNYEYDLSIDAELVRYGVWRIKRLASLSKPEIELPADSFLIECVQDILKQQKYINRNKE